MVHLRSPCHHHSCHPGWDCSRPVHDRSRLDHLDLPWYFPFHCYSVCMSVLPTVSTYKYRCSCMDFFNLFRHIFLLLCTDFAIGGGFGGWLLIYFSNVTRVSTDCTQLISILSFFSLYLIAHFFSSSVSLSCIFVKF